jgi:mediator of RNA polymerase II transcription subunit 31
MVANGDAAGGYDSQPLQGHRSPSPPWHHNFQDPDDGRQRFLLELEFVQLLANPTYIHYLAQNRYFDDEAFVGYLKYLLYWKQPEYAKFIMYPHAFFFLDMLQSANFRAAMAHPANKEVAHRQQYYFWKHYRNNRLKQILPRPLPEVPAPPPPPPPAPAPIVAAAPTKPEGSTRAGAGERRKRKHANS